MFFTDFLQLLMSVVIVSATPEPYVFGAPYYSAAYTIPVAAPATPTGTIPSVPTVSTTYPFSPISAYILEYSVPDVPLVSTPVASLIYNAPYTSVLPYAYATEYYTRK